MAEPINHKNIKGKKKNVEIRLVSIDFVPSWKDEDGMVHTMIGQAYIQAKDLPIDLQNKLIAICKQAMEGYVQ